FPHLWLPKLMLMVPVLSRSCLWISQSADLDRLRRFANLENFLRLPAILPSLSTRTYLMKTLLRQSLARKSLFSLMLNSSIGSLVKVLSDLSAQVKSRVYSD